MADHLYALPSGSRLEDYELQRVFSVGRHGIKYLAVQQGQDQPLAVREYLPDGLAVRQEGATVLPRSSTAKADFDAGLALFLDGARMQERVKHPNLVPVHRWFEANGTGYIIMDFVQGETLSALLERRKTLPEANLRELAQSILAPLEQMHDLGFLHQDIRPGDIIIRPDGSPLLLEPGLGRRTQGAARQAFGTQSRSLDLGEPTAGYSPLEQYSSRSRLGPWTDIYALGAVMYHCATGEPPPDAPSRAVQDDLIPAIKAGRSRYDEELLKAIDAALAIAPGQRPTSVASWRASFIKAEGAEKAHATRPGHVARGATRVAARGFGRPTARAPAGATEGAALAEQRGVRAKWALPTAAAVAFTALLTWMDVGILRSPQDDESPSADAEPSEQPQATTAQATDNVEEAPTASIDPDAAPEATPALATLVVQTEPSDAEVLLGDQLIGRTPLQLADLSPGEYDLKIQHPLYETLEVPGQSLVSGEVARVERTLVRATGALQVETDPPGAWVELDGARLAEATPVTLEQLPTGPVQLLLGAEGYATAAVDATVPRDDVGTVEFTLEPSIAFGTLTLALSPTDAQVTLPDLETPYSPGMRLPEGAHRVQLSAPGYLPETRTLEVVGDQRVEIALVAEPQPFTIAVTPAATKVRILGGEPYQPGMRLPPDDYRVRATLAGHQTWEETLSHGRTPTQREVTLNPGIGEFADPLAVGGGDGPLMVLLSAGRFRMGCLSEGGCRDNEGPVREVTVTAPFALSKYEVTFEQYNRFAATVERPLAERPTGWQQDAGQPVANVSWEDASAYAQWLSEQTGAGYRLPSEAEWEYAARAGGSAAYSWGNEVGSQLATCNGCGSAWDNDRPAPVGTFAANAWGLHEMHGNLWEWVQDCQSDSYQGASADVAARLSGDCDSRMLRGGAYNSSPEVIRAAAREWDNRLIRDMTTGFRVAMTVD